MKPEKDIESNNISDSKQNITCEKLPQCACKFFFLFTNLHHLTTAVILLFLTDISGKKVSYRLLLEVDYLLEGSERSVAQGTEACRCSWMEDSATARGQITARIYQREEVAMMFRSIIVNGMIHSR